jgi:hypothetical protein
MPKLYYNIPIHLKPGALFNRQKADEWDTPNKLIVEPLDGAPYIVPLNFTLAPKSARAAY